METADTLNCISLRGKPFSVVLSATRLPKQIERYVELRLQIAKTCLSSNNDLNGIVSDG